MKKKNLKNQAWYGKYFINCCRIYRNRQIAKSTWNDKSANNDIQISANTEICKNETINTIYSIKLKDAVEKKANLKVQVNESAPIKVSDYDLCRVLTNIIDNAINAVENSSLSKDIELNIVSNSNDILIKSKNAFA